MDDKLIDAILTDINNESEYVLKKEDIATNGATMLQYREIISFLCKSDFINQPFSNHGKLSILEKGKAVLRAGGWEKYLENEKLAKERSEQKSIYDLKISKFQATYGKYALHISATALLISIATLVIGLLMYKARTKELEMKQLELESKIEILDSSFRNSKKIKYN